MFLRIACQQLQIGLAIFVIKEDRGAIVTALRYVMWIAGSYDTCDSWHSANDTVEIKVQQQEIWGVSLFIQNPLGVTIFVSL